MKTRVLDSWAVLEWIAGRQPASGLVDSLLSAADEGRAMLRMSSINAGEIYYCLRKNHSRELAEYWRESAPTLPVSFDVPASADIWQAAEIKADYPVAYADAFAAGLARKHSCPLVTGDPDFRKIEWLELDWTGRVKS
jgi:ribonuclease VapC